MARPPHCNERWFNECSYPNCKCPVGNELADMFTDEQKAKFKAQDALYDETMQTP